MLDVELQAALNIERSKVGVSWGLDGDISIALFDRLNNRFALLLCEDHVVLAFDVVNVPKAAPACNTFLVFHNQLSLL